MRALKSGISHNFSTYQNLKDCKSKHFFEIGNKFIKSYHSFKQPSKSALQIKAFSNSGII